MKCINNGADGAKQVPAEAMTEACSKKSPDFYRGLVYETVLQTRATNQRNYLSVSN